LELAVTAGSGTGVGVRVAVAVGVAVAAGAGAAGSAARVGGGDKLMCTREQTAERISGKNKGRV